MRSRSFFYLLACLGSSSLACSGAARSGPGVETVRVEPLRVSATPPGRVQALVSVADRGPSPDELGPERFEVREADLALDPTQIQLRVQPLGELRGHEAIVLVDGSHAFTDEERGPLGAAFAQLVDRLRFHQGVTLLAFDGSAELRLIAHYARSAMAAPLGKDPGIERLLSYRPHDSSSSLYSAIVRGRKALDERLTKNAAIPPLGSLIVVARGPDQAGRADEAAARAALEGRRSFLLKVGTWSKDTSLDWVGDGGTRAAASLGTLGSPVDELAHLVDDVFLRSYLVSYCSPARGGKRQLEVVVNLPDESGHARQIRAAGEFDATGFNASCRATVQHASTR
jgi:hypothetical protein